MNEQIDPRERVAAARCFVDSLHSEEQVRAAEMAAFMGIFHPDHPATDELIRGARERARDTRRIR